MNRAEKRVALAATALTILLIVQWLMPLDLGLPTVVAAAVPPVAATSSALPPYPGLVPGALFSASRQATDADGTADDLRAYALLGVSLSPRAASALLKGPRDFVTLRPGQNLAGWRLAGLDRRQARFDQSGKHIILTVGAAAQPAQDANPIPPKEAP